MESDQWNIYNRMEEIDKQQYLRFYGSNQRHNTSHHRSREQKNKYERLKMLPHISEQYNFRITNHLLIKKILSPKRDKIIMHSLQNVGKHSPRRGLTATRERWRTSHKNRSLHSSMNHTKSTSKLVEAEPNQSPKITVIVRNPKQISKIIHNRYQDSPYKTQQSQLIERSLFTESKQSENVPIAPTRSLHQLKKNTQANSIHSFNLVNPNSFGTGSTILKIIDLYIDVNPAIKFNALVQLELISRTGFIRQIHDVKDQKPERTIKTKPIAYCNLPRINQPDSSIKFSINLSKIGDFVPLRIWKYTGVQCTMIGTVDLPLISYGDDQGQTEVEVKPLKQKTVIQQRRDDPNFIRKVIYGQISRRLVKLKMHECEATVHLKYKVYPKRFKQADVDKCVED